MNDNSADVKDTMWKVTSVLFAAQCILINQGPYLMDIRKDTSIGNSHMCQQFTQLFIIPDGQLDVSWNDSGLLVITSSITSQLKNLSTSKIDLTLTFNAPHNSIIAITLILTAQHHLPNIG